MNEVESHVEQFKMLNYGSFMVRSTERKWLLVIPAKCEEMMGV